MGFAPLRLLHRHCSIQPSPHQTGHTQPTTCSLLTFVFGHKSSMALPRTAQLFAAHSTMVGQLIEEHSPLVGLVLIHGLQILASRTIAYVRMQSIVETGSLHTFIESKHREFILLNWMPCHAEMNRLYFGA
mmetsp:Transcript_46126/g.81358  ORF Transcript_46126/g.81358 Transcript_46126/m.81358 type:complete len:131 (-) Transcript_46126:90-482(-)